jgi:hypothetical protein
MDLTSAGLFVEASARLIDRHRFDHQFRDGDPGRVRAALLPYRNADGGFGNALEPDLRGLDSQPEPTRLALEILVAELGMSDDPAVGDACDWLVTASTAEGGVPFVLPTARGHSHAPWWEPPGDASPNLTPTAGLVAILVGHGVEHAWVGPAEAWCWEAIESLEASGPYELRSVIPFLDHAADRPRAERALERIAPFVAEHVTLDPADTGAERHRPLDFAPSPASLARRLFDDAVIDRNLDALAAGQRDDGGWTFDWPAWAPASEPDWRGWMTVRALGILRDYGRFQAAS